LVGYSKHNQHYTDESLKVLIVEDEENIIQFLLPALERAGYEVETASDGESGFEKAKSAKFDLVLLDITLPKMEGTEVLKNLRDAGVNTPAIMLTGRTDTDDKLKSFEYGCDDYLTKPYRIEELKARIKAVIGRASERGSTPIALSELEMDPLRHRVTIKGENVHLTVREYNILEILLKNPGDAVEKDKIIQYAWEPDHAVAQNTLEVHINSLRKKIKKDDFLLLETVRGVGYLIRKGTLPGQE
jgi:DNA-binding response OmpR family regulator